MPVFSFSTSEFLINSKRMSKYGTPLPAEMQTVLYSSPVGPLSIHISNKFVVAIRFNARIKPEPASYIGTAKQVLIELDRYFMDPGFQFSVARLPRGTVFQHRVWDALLELAPGETMTYGALAGRLSTSPRAIGGACRANPIPILIPCHRIVGSRNAGGYMGREKKNIDIKSFLLAHEKG